MLYNGGVAMYALNVFFFFFFESFEVQPNGVGGVQLNSIRLIKLVMSTS